MFDIAGKRYWWGKMVVRKCSAKIHKRRVDFSKYVVLLLRARELIISGTRRQ